MDQIHFHLDEPLIEWVLDFRAFQIMYNGTLSANDSSIQNELLACLDSLENHGDF